MTRGHSVLGIANQFLIRGLSDDQALTPMQLQKLCYMAHGFTLALLDKPLTSDTIEAWGFGPVYPDLYDALKGYGSKTVDGLVHENNWASADHIRGSVVKVDLTKKEREIIETVWEDYGHFEGFQLSALTHEPDTPWAKVYKPGKKHIVIPDELIKEYFVELTAAAS